MSAPEKVELTDEQQLTVTKLHDDLAAAQYGMKIMAHAATEADRRLVAYCLPRFGAVRICRETHDGPVVVLKADEITP